MDAELLIWKLFLAIQAYRAFFVVLLQIPLAKPSGDGLNGFFFSYDEMEFSRWTMAVTVATGRTIAKQ